MSIDFKFDWNSDSAINNVQIGAERGLQVAVEFLLDEALKLVPIDEGSLASSGATTVEGLEAAVSFDTPYAIRQHEDTTLQHKNGRSAKYLETPLKQNGKKLEALLAAALKEALE